MNLLQARWLPVRTRHGQRRRVSADELADAEIVAFDTERADFNGALMQFAIALLQMALPVDSATQWRQRFERPPDRQGLRDAFAPFVDAFRLDGDGARFMQDFELRNADEEPTPIGNLLIDAPGENALKKNTDLFVKRNRHRHMCPACAAMALFALQTDSPADGPGFRTGLRGGGPLTTLLVSAGAYDTLWSALWLNVLTTSVLHSLGGESINDRPWHRFPWLGPISRLQPRKDSEVQPSQVHPMHVWWAMPQRIRLDFNDVRIGRCDLCSDHSEILLSQYVTRNYGLNYKGPWRHPLSPYYAVKDEWLPMHPQPGGVGYKDWLGLVLGLDNDKRRIEAAAVVSEFLQDKQRTLARNNTTWRLWCFGYDMKQAKARCWYESTLPLFDLADCGRAAREHLGEQVRDWIGGAEVAASCLRTAVKSAWFGKESRGDLSHVDAAFWSATEPRFYRMLHATVQALREGAADDGLALKSEWQRHLAAQAERLFEEAFVGAGPIGQQNPARVAKAHRELLRHLLGARLRDAVGLPKPVAAKKARASPRTARRRGDPDVAGPASAPGGPVA